MYGCMVKLEGWKCGKILLNYKIHYELPYLFSRCQFRFLSRESTKRGFIIFLKNEPPRQNGFVAAEDVTGKTIFDKKSRDI